MSGATNGFCFNRHGEGNAYWYDFHRPSEGVWHTGLQNFSGKETEDMSWFQNNYS